MSSYDEDFYKGDPNRKDPPRILITFKSGKTQELKFKDDGETYDQYDYLKSMGKPVHIGSVELQILDTRQKKWITLESY